MYTDLAEALYYMLTNTIDIDYYYYIFVLIPNYYYTDLGEALNYMLTNATYMGLLLLYMCPHT